jgi:hypothetical protein
MVGCFVSYNFVCSHFTMGETKFKKNVELMKKRERLNDNGNKLIFVQKEIVGRAAYKLLDFRRSTM